MFGGRLPRGAAGLSLFVDKWAFEYCRIMTGARPRTVFVEPL
jgi:hypothetical protein